MSYMDVRVFAPSMGKFQFAEFLKRVFTMDRLYIFLYVRDRPKRTEEKVFWEEGAKLLVDNFFKGYWAEGVAFVSLVDDACGIVVKRFDHELVNNEKAPYTTLNISLTHLKDVMIGKGKPGHALGKIISLMKGNDQISEHSTLEQALRHIGLSGIFVKAILAKRRPPKRKLKYDPWKDDNQPCLPFMHIEKEG